MQIYLDHNATAPLLEDVAEAMAECDRQGFANPASQHAAGRRARQVLEEAREGIAALLGADLTSAQPDRLIFTSGGTEANNLAILGLAGDVSGRLLISGIEHPSVAGPAEELERRGWKVERLRVRRDGTLDLEHARELLQSAAGDGETERRRDGERTPPAPNPQSPVPSPQPLAPFLATLMLGNNETGVLQPVREFVTLCRIAHGNMERQEDSTRHANSIRRGNIKIHTDAVQVAGKLPIDFGALGVDTLSIAAHKFHGPRGIGALLVRGDTALRPVLFGGFQQGGLRPGTESVTLAVGMHAALAAWHREQQARIERLTALRDRFERAILAGWTQAVVNGVEAARLPHTSNIAFVGLERQALQMALDLAGVACSTGSACASGSTDVSPTLVAMGCEEPVLASSLRFSLGAGTTAAEVDEAAERILKICKELGNRFQGRKMRAAGRTST